MGTLWSMAFVGYLNLLVGLIAGFAVIYWFQPWRQGDELGQEGETDDNRVLLDETEESESETVYLV